MPQPRRDVRDHADGHPLARAAARPIRARTDRGGAAADRRRFLTMRCCSQRHGGTLCNCAALRAAPFTAILLQPLQQNAALVDTNTHPMRPQDRPRDIAFLLFLLDGCDALRDGTPAPIRARDGTRQPSDRRPPIGAGGGEWQEPGRRPIRCRAPMGNGAPSARCRLTFVAADKTHEVRCVTAVLRTSVHS